MSELGHGTCSVCKRTDAVVVVPCVAVIGGQRVITRECSWCWTKYERELAGRREERAA